MSEDLSQRRHRVAVLVDEGSNPFEIACMTEVLGIERAEVGGLLYDVTFVARTARVTMRQGFFTMGGLASLESLDDADTVVVPNRPDTTRPHHPLVLDAIRRSHQRGARLVGMCSGAFTLAEAGVLDGRRVTVHWQWAEEFRVRHPAVHLEEAVLYVDDGDILTSGGSAAALDLGLHLVARDHGVRVASLVSRRLVFSAHRPGGQQQFIETPLPRPAAADPLAATLEWALSRLDEPLTVGDLAARAGLSRATLHRRFAATLGCTPLAWLHAQRVARARVLLETTDLPLDQVAVRSGLGTDASLRMHLVRVTGTTPGRYRAAHRRPA